MKTKYKAKGMCLGKFWGGGEGAYPTIEYDDFDELSKLEKDIKEDIETGSIDSGMGFESMIGAFMQVFTIRTISFLVDNEPRDFKNTSSDYKFYGNLSEKQKKFLSECLIC